MPYMREMEKLKWEKLDKKEVDQQSQEHRIHLWKWENDGKNPDYNTCQSRGYNEEAKRHTY